MKKDKADQLIVKYSQKIFGFAMKKAFSYDEAEELSGEMLKEVYLSFFQYSFVSSSVKIFASTSFPIAVKIPRGSFVM